MASAVIRSFQLIALVLSTGVVAAQAQTAAPKAWADPGAVERAKTADPAAATPATDAAKADAAKAAAAKPGVDPKQAASDSEKLKELIRASEAAEAGKAKAASSKHAHHVHHAHHVAHAHAAAPKKVAAKAVRRPIAYEYLPNKKDGPVPSSSGPISAAY